MNPLELRRLTRIWQPGDRCVSIMRIVYAHAAREVPEGLAGVVVSVDTVPFVRWEGPEAPEVVRLGIATSPEAIDPWRAPVGLRIAEAGGPDVDLAHFPIERLRTWAAKDPRAAFEALAYLLDHDQGAIDLALDGVTHEHEGIQR